MPPTWKPFDPSGLRQRIQRVRVLLLQAAAVGLAQDTERLSKIAELGAATSQPKPTPRPRRPRQPR
jgi:hypothetical protein